MATLTVQEISRSGLEATYGAASAGGDDFPNDGKKAWFHVKNGGGGSIDVTFETPGLVDGLAIGDLVVSVPAGEEREIGPFPIAYYGSSVAVTYSGVTSVTVAAKKLP